MKPGLAILLALLLAAPLRSGPPEGELSVAEVLTHIDELYRSQSSYAEVEMQVETPHWQRSLRMNIWTDSMEKTLIRILSPKKERGVGTLRLRHEMWNYLPRTNKVIKVPPSMMMSSWMGSDFSNDDLVREYTFRDDYEFAMVTPPDAKKELLYIRCVPKEGVPIVWGKVVIAVQRQGYLPVWQKYYDEKGRVMRVLTFSEIVEFSGRKMPSLLEMAPQSKKGHKTAVRYLRLDLNKTLPPETFSLRRLRSQ